MGKGYGGSWAAVSPIDGARVSLLTLVREGGDEVEGTARRDGGIVGRDDGERVGHVDGDSVTGSGASRVALGLVEDADLHGVRAVVEIDVGSGDASAAARLGDDAGHGTAAVLPVDRGGVSAGSDVRKSDLGIVEVDGASDGGGERLLADVDGGRDALLS